MPTFDSPRRASTAVYQALRDLAHASNLPADPAATYAVIGDLLGGVRALRQVFDQLASEHITHRARAHDDFGDQAAGARAALAAADELKQAGTLLDAVEARLDAASQHSGRIAWLPATPSESQPRRWISVVFLDGEEGDKVIDLIGASGTDAAIEHLAGFDYGEDTVQDALANGYVYDTPPRGTLDKVATRDVYTLTYNPHLGHVNLLREHDVIPNPALLGHDAPEPPATRRELTDWFARRSNPAASGRGLAL